MNRWLTTDIKLCLLIVILATIFLSMPSLNQSNRLEHSPIQTGNLPAAAEILNPPGTPPSATGSANVTTAPVTH